MRRALGLDAQAPPPSHSPPQRAAGGHMQARHRHRFVADGEVPVEMVPFRGDANANHRQDSTAAATQEAQAARERAERSLAAAQGTIRDLQTKLAHASLARDEAEAAMQRLQDEVRTLRTAAAAPVAALPEPQVRRRGRPPKSAKPPAVPPENTAKPVKWWVRGWRERDGH